MTIDYAMHSRTFDPSDIELLFVQDEVGQRYGEWPHCVRDFERMPDATLAQMITGCADALLLPLSENFLGGIREVFTEARSVANTRLFTREKAARRRRETGERGWADADLLGEVEALAGQGRRKGNAYWFHCPIPGHPNGDRNPSLEVDPVGKVWKCWSLHGGGGVLAWRKAIG